MSVRKIHNQTMWEKINKMKKNDRKIRDHDVCFDENEEKKHNFGSSNGLWISENVLACKIQ